MSHWCEVNVHKHLEDLAILTGTHPILTTASLQLLKLQTPSIPAHLTIQTTHTILSFYFVISYLLHPFIRVLCALLHSPLGHVQYMQYAKASSFAFSETTLWQLLFLALIFSTTSLVNSALTQLTPVAHNKQLPLHFITQSEPTNSRVIK